MNYSKPVFKKQPKILSLVLRGVALTVSQLVNADVADIIKSNSQIGAQFVTTDVDYTETSKEGIKADTETGFVPGFGISLSVMKNLIIDNAYFAFQFSQLHGDTDYIGSSNVSAPVILGPASLGAYGSLTQQNGAKLVDFSGRFGKGFELGNSFMITPFVEIGHHNWKRRIDTEVPIITIAPASTVSRESYNNYYYAFGAMGQFSPVSKLVVTANAMVGSTFSSSMASSGVNSIAVGAIGQDGGAGTLHLGSSVFYKVGLGLDYAFYKSFHVNAGAEYVGFEYGRSAMTGPSSSYYEPDSETNYLTVKAGFGYAF
jgi:opacity protein-like surface antigen